MTFSRLIPYVFFGFVGAVLVLAWQSLPHPVELSDSFDDGDFSSNPAWVSHGGSWEVLDTAPHSGRLRTTTPTIPNLIFSAFESDSVPISMDARVQAATSTDQLEIGVTDSGSSLGNGYLLRLLVNGPNSLFDFFRIDEGETTPLMSLKGVDAQVGVDYRISASRDESGYWSFTLNGVPMGTPAKDSAHTRFTHVFLQGYNIASPGQTFDDILVRAQK